MHSKLDPIADLEKRIRNLEVKVYGEPPYPSSVPMPVVDSFIQTLSMTSMALTGREKINGMLKRLDSLETILDPCYEDMITDSATKTELIVAMEPQLHETIAQLTQLNDLTRYLDSESIRNVPNISNRLVKVTSVALSNQERANKVSAEVHDFVQRYNAVIHELTKTFAHLDAIVTGIEMRASASKTAK